MVRVLVAMGVAFISMSAATAQLPLTKAQVTQSLFQEYIANPHRVESDQVRAAVVLVASRGLDDPEIVDCVLQEFMKACKEQQGARWPVQSEAQNSGSTFAYDGDFRTTTHRTKPTWWDADSPG